jgi:hypothetical protein
MQKPFIQILTYLLLASTPLQSFAAMMTFDGVLEPGEIRRIGGYEEAGIYATSAEYMVLYSGARQEYLDSDVLAITIGDKPAFTLASSEPFKFHSLSVRGSQATGASSLWITLWKEDLVIRQRFLIDDSRFHSLSLDDVFNPLYFTAMQLEFEYLAESGAPAPSWFIDDITLSSMVVPEPSTYALMGLGLLTLMFVRRRV